MSDLVCEHGSLRRKCEICERDDRIKELGEFIVWLFQEWCPGGDIDGGVLQEEMERRGLILPHVVTAEESDEAGDFCEWEKGDTIYVLSPEFEALRGEER